MLVLTRKEHEKIVLYLPNGTDVTITLTELRGDKARIGIDADPAILIYRGEIWEEICEQKELRSGTAPVSESEPCSG